MSDPCPACPWDWPVIMSPAGRFHAYEIEKSRVGRAWLAADNAPCLLELLRCTQPRGPVLTLLRGGLDRSLVVSEPTRIRVDILAAAPVLLGGPRG